jgi:hypothetical protein
VKRQRNIPVILFATMSGAEDRKTPDLKDVQNPEDEVR